MYHPEIIERRKHALLRQPHFRALYPQGLPEYSVQEAQSLTAQILQAVDPEDSTKRRRRFTAEEDRFMAVASLRGMFDAPWWLECFVWIDQEGHGLRPLYPLWESQRFILQRLAYLEKKHADEDSPDGLLVNVLKARQLGACLDPATRVLTAALQWVPIEQVLPGTEIVAVDEHVPGGRGAARRMTTTVVEARADVYEPAFKITFTDGTTITATGSHRFLYRLYSQTDTAWRSVVKMRAGDLIRYATKPWEAPELDDAWFGGLLDGEGSMSARRASGAEVNVAQVDGPVWRRAEAYLRSRGYAYRIETDPGTRPSKFGSRPVNKLCVSRMDEIFRLVGQTRPTRFIERRWWEGKELPGKRNGFGWKTILNIAPVGTRRMIDLQTTAKTFIAEGLVSHNSTLAQALVAHRIYTQSHIRAIAGSDVEAQATYLFKMNERIWAQLPFFLRPDRIVPYKAGNELNVNNGSSLRAAWGKTTRGALQETGGKKGNIERGRTNSVVHISELATWDNPEQLDSSLLPGVPVAPTSLVLFESTAELAGDWWHRHWQACADGTTPREWSNIFIPWCVEPSKYSRRPPESWTPSAETLAIAATIERDSAQWVGQTLHLTKDQLYWYEGMRRYHAGKNQLHQLFKEYPSNPEECFMYSGHAVFTFEEREAINAKARSVIDVWSVDPSRDIAELKRLPPDDPDKRDQDQADRRRYPVPLATKIPARTAEQQLVPQGYGFRRLTKAELEALPSLRHTVMAVYEYPRLRGRRRYVLGVDVGDGLLQDFSVVSVVREPTIEEPAEEVAQFVSNTVKPSQLAFVVDAIGHFYCDEDGIEATAAIELNNHGVTVQDLLQLHLGYTNFYVWEVVDAGDPSARFTKRIGWQTTTRTRPILLEKFHDAVTTTDPISGLADFRLNSPITRAELGHFVTEGLLGEAEHAKGQHDDCIFASAIAYYVAYRLSGGESEPIAERRRRRAARVALQEAGGAVRIDWRNSAVSAEAAKHGEDDDADEFADASPDDLYFDARRHA